MQEDKSEKPVRYVINFWVILIALMVVGLAASVLLFGLRQGR